MRNDLIGRRIRLDAERGVGEEADPGGRGLLQLAVRATVDVVLPHREVALLRQRMRDRTGVSAAKRLELFGGKADDDLVLDRDDLEQVHPGVLCQCALSENERENRECGSPD